MKAVLLSLLVGCAPQAMTTNTQHPANPDAPTGRLAGPPAALRPGVADVSTPTRETTTPATTTDHSSHGVAPQAPASDHSGHQQGQPEPAKSDPAKGADKTEPAKTQPTPQKPAPTKPTEKPRKPPASKKPPGTETPKQTPPPAQGHEGH